jgi:hypothetical protein
MKEQLDYMMHLDGQKKDRMHAGIQLLLYALYCRHKLKLQEAIYGKAGSILMHCRPACSDSSASCPALATPEIWFSAGMPKA